MKKLIKKIALVFAAAAVGFGFCFAPVTSTVYAEEVTQETTETGENGTGTGEETNETTENEETPTEEESGENTGEFTFDFTSLSYEDFLAFVESFANETGHADEWNDTVNAVKKAIDEKQFTLATVVQILLMAVLIWKIAADMIAKRKEKKHIETTEKQTAKINEQTAAINEQTETAARVEEDEHKTHVAIKHLCNMVLTLAERINMGEASKEAIRSEANEVRKTLEG